MKKFSVLFCFILILGIALSQAKETGKYKGEILLIEHSEKHVAVRVEEPNPIGVCFQAPCSFSDLSVCCPSYGDNIGDLTVSLYRWKKDLQTTLTQKADASHQFINFADNAVLRFSFDSLPKGSYLIRIHSPRQTVGVWMMNEKTEGIETWLGDQPIDKTPQIGFGFSSDFPFQGTLNRYHQLQNASSTAPKEPEISEEDPIRRFDVQPDTWYATDDLGRDLPDQSQTGPRRSGKQVGIFYWTWHDALSKVNNGAGPFDNTKITRQYPEAVRDINHPAWGPIYHPHHWGEPLFGYYATCDKWVMRKHAELLADALVDVVVFDCTNGTNTWMNSTWALLEAFSEARADGVRTPKIAFMLPFGSLPFNRTDLVQLYRDLYRDGKYRDLWFYWNGKPMIYAIPESLEKDLPTGLSAEEKKELETIRNFFTFRPPQPTYTGGPRRPDNWGWLELYPQNGYVEKGDGSYEMVCVGASQNNSAKNLSGKSGLSAMNDINIFGRAYVVGAPKDPRPNAFLYGGNFQQQWNRAFEIDPDYIFITSWNEWIASRFPKWMGLTNAFPDEFDTEFSRDVEPSRGILKDTFYLQMTANIRKFKGVGKLSPASEPQTIDLNSASTGEDPWKNVQPVYRDYRGDTGKRDAIGYGKIRYTNNTGRNDIVLSKMTRDRDKIYFMVETSKDLTPKSDPGWMRLLIKTAGSKKQPNWESFTYIVNRKNPKNLAVIERSKGGWNWEKTGNAEYRITGNRLEIALEKKSLGFKPEDKIDLYFKWSDNMQKDGDPLDFYQYGDAAPDGRFTWRYRE